MSEESAASIVMVILGMLAGACLSWAGYLCEQDRRKASEATAFVRQEKLPASETCRVERRNIDDWRHQVFMMDGAFTGKDSPNLPEAQRMLVEAERLYIECANPQHTGVNIVAISGTTDELQLEKK